jgi:hypothetical protein
MFRFRRKRLRLRPIRSFYGLSIVVPAACRVVGNWALNGELPTDTRCLPVSLLAQECNLLAKRLGQRLSLAPAAVQELGSQSEKFLLDLLVHHPSWAYLWQRLIVERLMIRKAPDQQRRQFSLDMLVEKAEDLRWSFSAFSAYLGLAIHNVVRLLAAMKRRRPAWVIRWFRTNMVTDYLAKAAALVSTPGEEDSYQWQSLEPGDFLVISICREVLEQLCSEITKIAFRWRQRRWWEYIINAEYWLQRVAWSVAALNFLEKEVAQPIRRWDVFRPVFDHSAGWDPKSAGYFLRCLAEKSSPSWSVWLAWQLSRRIIVNAGEEPSPIDTLTVFVHDDSPVCFALTLQTLSQVLAYGNTLPPDKRSGFFENPGRRVLKLCAEILAKWAQRREIQSPLRAPPLELVFQPFLPHVHRTIDNLMELGPEGLRQAGDFFVHLFRCLQMSQRAFAETEKVLGDFPLRVLLQRWLRLALATDPSTRFLSWNGHGSQNGSNGQLRRTIEHLLATWLKPSAETDFTGEAADPSLSTLQQLQRCAAVLAACDPEIATILRLSLIQGICRGKYPC